MFDSLFGNRDLEDLQTTLTTADGDLLSVKAKTDVDLCINEIEFSTTVVVAQLGDLSGILGLDFLSKYEAIMDMNAGRLHSPFFGDIGLVKEDKLHSTCARIHMTETVIIPAKCEMFVKGNTDCEFPHGVEGLLEPLSNSKGILLPNLSSKYEITKYFSQS